jgi:hypothetical protein
MEKVSVSINVSIEEMLFGISYSNCIAEDIQSGAIAEANILSIGFILFTIDIYIRK